MPNRTQYIRNEDVEAWDAIENKSEWIHRHLTLEKAKQVIESAKSKTCPNGHSIPEGRSKCMGKGCKYS